MGKLKASSLLLAIAVSVSACGSLSWHPLGMTEDEWAQLTPEQRLEAAAAAATAGAGSDAYDAAGGLDAINCSRRSASSFACV
jgi:hypothetical protein